MLLVMGHMIYLCLALCTLKPKKPKNLLKKIQKNLGFFPALLYTGLRTPLRTFVEERIVLHLHTW